MQAYDSLVFIQQGKSEFNLLCLITFITSMEAYSMALHLVDLSMYFIQLCFPTKILYVFLVLLMHTEEEKGKTEKCLQNCSQKTYTQIFISIHIFQISNKLELNWEGPLRKICGSFCKDTTLDARIYVLC